MGKSKDLATGSSTLYQTQATSDTRYANVAGDTFTGDVRINGDLGLNGVATDANWNTAAYGNTEVAIDGGGGYSVLHLRGDGAGSTNTRYSMGVGDGIFYMAYDDVATTHRIKVQSNGSVNKPSQPFFMGLNFAGRVGSDKASFSTIQQNGNNWNNSTGYFTCPTAGEYLVVASSGYKATDAYLGWGIKYNNSVDLYGWSSYLTNHAHATQCISYIKKANANDTFAAFIANHSSYTTPYVGNNYCAFSVYLLG